MNSFRWMIVGVSALLLSGVCQAQFADTSGFQSAPPGFSPYLNLLRGGSTPAINYYNLVKPQIQTQTDLQSLRNTQERFQQQFRLATQPPSGGGTPQVPGYNTHMRYFGTAGQISAGTGLAPRQSLTDQQTINPNAPPATRSVFQMPQNNPVNRPTFYNPFRSY